jgi:hypothetical protein
LPGRTAHEAWENYVGPMRRALQCVTLGRFTLLERTPDILPDTTYVVALNRMDSVRLRSREGLYLVAGQRIRIYEANPELPQERYRVTTLWYAYGFTQKARDGSEEELIAFHWDRERTAQNPYPLGHLHIGPALLANQTVIRPGDFHNAHIPTERVALEAVVRFAITELNVQPLCDDWETILEATEEAFKTHKTM